jgi:hypothetical protein
VEPARGALEEERQDGRRLRRRARLLWQEAALVVLDAAADVPDGKLVAFAPFIAALTRAAVPQCSLVSRWLSPPSSPACVACSSPRLLLATRQTPAQHGPPCMQ